MTRHVSLLLWLHVVLGWERLAAASNLMSIFLSGTTASSVTKGMGGRFRAAAAKAKSTSVPPTGSRSNNHTKVIQIIETEFWDGSDWRGDTITGGGSRWNDVHGQPCNSPGSQACPRGYQFAADDGWKIVTSASRDALGWEYQWESTASTPPRRSRIWLRIVIPMQETGVGPPRRKYCRAVRQRPTPSWLQPLRDDFNFKGFACSFYKSLLSRSVGVALRLPLTYNFGLCERNAALPSLSASLCGHYPWLGMLFVSGSLRVEWVQWMAHATVAWTRYVLLYAAWTIFRGTLLALSAVMFPLTRRLVDWHCPLTAPQLEACRYNRDLEERIGASVSWRVSPERGYHFHVTYWHYYGPTVTSLYHMMGLSSLLNNYVPSWMSRRAAALALSTGGPTLAAPHVFVDAILALNGYYFRRPQSKASSMSSSNVAASDYYVPRSSPSSSLPMPHQIAPMFNITADDEQLARVPLENGMERPPQPPIKLKAKQATAS